MISCSGPENGICVTRGWGFIHDKRICMWCRSDYMPSDVNSGINCYPCIHMQDTGESVPDRPCKGNYIICGNIKCPAHEVQRIHSTCGCRPTKCKFYESKSAHIVGVVIPARNESDVYQTVESHRLGGAHHILVVDDASVMPVKPIDGVIVIRNDIPQGPAACRNRWRELPAECDIVGFSDAHVRVSPGAWKELAESAHSSGGISCACSQSMNGSTVYRGGDIRQDEGMLFSCPGVTRMREKPALYGSVYAAPRVIMEHTGGWPPTVTWGYNEQAFTLSARGAGVPIVVCDVVAKHDYRKKFPYPVRNSHVEINRVLAHWLTSTDDEWIAWQEHFIKKYPAAMDALPTHTKEREAWRRHYLSIRQQNPVFSVGGVMPKRNEYRLATLGGYGDILMLSAIAAGIKRHNPQAITTLCTKRRNAWDLVKDGSFDKLSRYTGEPLLRYPDAGRRIKPTKHLVRHMWQAARTYWPDLPEEIGGIEPSISKALSDITPTRGIGIISHWDSSRGWASKKSYPHSAELCRIINERGINAELIGQIDGSIADAAKRIAEYETLIVTEGFLHHLAAGLGRKCFVLVGPTPANTHIYDGQVAIRADVPCGICFDTKPCRMPTSCMTALAPEYVADCVCNVGAEWAKSSD